MGFIQQSFIDSISIGIYRQCLIRVCRRLSGHKLRFSNKEVMSLANCLPVGSSASERKSGDLRRRTLSMLGPSSATIAIEIYEREKFLERVDLNKAFKSLFLA